MKHRYRVVNGFHVEGKKRYAKGEIIESEIDLASTFANKFEDLGEVDKDAGPKKPTAAEKKAAKALAAAKKKDGEEADKALADAAAADAKKAEAKTDGDGSDNEPDADWDED